MFTLRNLALSLLVSSQILTALPALSSTPSVDGKKQSKKLTPAASRRTASDLPKWSVNINVPFRSWIPRNEPREVLLCVHGLGFSSKSFSEFGRMMAARGFAVYAMDVRGFGAWMNHTGDDRVDFEACLSDVEGALRTLRNAYPHKPLFLIGESMGGAIVMRAASRNPQLVDGMVSSVPSSDRYAKLSSEIIVGAHYLEDKDKPMDLKPEVLDRTTSDPALRAKFEADPSNRMKLTPKELKQFNDFMKGNNDAAALIEKTPVLMLAGFKDKLVKPEGTIELFNLLSTPDKMLMIVGDSEHLLLEENQLTGQLAQLLSDWITSESAAARQARR
ncbi:MAG: lysophospholipase [Candidatus Obscuribacterales bacterium]|nr:lysophospholipase [Candidatus Obscuribacterales bacterium]